MSRRALVRTNSVNMQEINQKPLHEISLEGELTIHEVFNFYGQIYGMKRSDLLERQIRLVNLLELPDPNVRISRTSGGQQRRISMAVTLLHDPKLLILDEPTVGVDPLLRSNIWDYFTSLSSEEGKTIIITTHYIEEARYANVIGLMRKGILLAEESPVRLMNRFDCDTLEEVFLDLSQRQQDEEENEDLEQSSYPEVEKNIPKPLEPQDKGISLDKLKAQLIKNFYWTSRNISVTLFAICMPPLLYVIIGLIAEADKGPVASTVKMGITSREVATCLQTTPASVPGLPCASTQPFSCRYRDHLSALYDTDYYTDFEEGEEAVRRGKALGVIGFHSNFTLSLFDRITRRSKISNTTFDQSTAVLALDMTEYPKSMRAVRDIMDSLFNFLEEMCLDCGLNPKLASIPISVEKYFYGSKNGSVINALVPSYLCSVAFYSTLVFTSTSILMERKSGSFERTRIAGLKYTEMILAHIIVQIMVMCVQNLFSLVVLYRCFSFPMEGSLGAVFIIFNITELFGMSSGFFLAMLLDEHIDVSYAGIGIILALFTLCGTVWPVECTHWLLKPISKVIPVTMVGKSYLNVAIKGWSLAHPGVFSGILATIAATIAVSILTYFLVMNKLN